MVLQNFRRNLGGVAVNGMVLCPSEVPDGSAHSMTEQVSLELEKLRDIAYALNLRDPQTINWTLFTSPHLTLHPHKRNLIILLNSIGKGMKKLMDLPVLKLLNLLKIFVLCTLVAIYERLSLRV